MAVKTTEIYHIFNQKGVLFMKIRKGISAVLAGVMALAALPVSAMSASAEGAYALGDVDMDGVVTGHDTAMVSRYVLDDTYTLTEIATDKGYVLLKDGVEIVIAAAESENACETCGAKLLTASGTVNGEPANMESGNAIVPLMVINNPGFDLPKTGGYGTWMFTVGGCMLLGVAAFIVIRGRKHNKNDQ